MHGILNEVTNTVHKRETGQSDFQSACGATAQLSHDKLRVTAVKPDRDGADATRCGRCFDGAGGY